MEEDNFKSKFKKIWKKFWFIVWKDDSLKGWIISLIFLFIVIKGIFFPFMSLVTGTKLPLVIVESCSMYHEDNLFSNFDDWYNTHYNNYLSQGITKESWKNFPFKKGFNKGDILFITGTKPQNLEVGDVIIFSSVIQSTPIIHRIVSIEKENEEYIFKTMGDNVGRIQSFEQRINQEQIVGKARINIGPYIGWIKLIFFEFKQPENNKGFCEVN